MKSSSEIQRIQNVYRKKDAQPKKADLFDRFHRQEVFQEIKKKLDHNFAFDLSTAQFLEMGCGNGSNLLEIIHLGFLPKNIYANELSFDRLKQARKNLPSAVHFIEGDAMKINKKQRFNCILQSTVFTSILSDRFKVKLAQKLYTLLKPGGVLIWYDFIFDNPWNPHVKGISRASIKSLFPEARIEYKKITLLPPLGRFLLNHTPWLYFYINRLNILKTHVLGFIYKS